MKALFKIITVIIFISFLTNPLKASHFAGSDLTYTCLGGTTYEFTLVFYRDCSGATPPVSPILYFECSSNPAFNFNSTMTKIGGCTEITQPCSNYSTTCNNGNYYGIQECIYKVTVNLPPCNQWEMHYTSCCRNPITTVPNNNSNNWYIDANLNNQLVTCNSSPRFTNKPVAIICANQTFCFNHGAIDPDGDSLSYSFYTPQTAKNVPVSYAFGYTQANFLNSSTGISLDPLTGDICMTPTTILTTIIGIRVEEWRTINGTPTLLGIVNRDMQLKVENCPNTLPQLSGMDTLLTASYNPNDTIYWKEMCLGPTVQFHINGNDSDVYDPNAIGSPEKFSITWNNGIPGGTFQTFHNNTDSAYAMFTWTPTSADVSNTPKCFTATVQDDACPYNGMQTYSYCITVRGMLVDIGSDTTLCKGEDVIYRASADTSTLNYNWFLDGTAVNSMSGIDSAIFIQSANLNPGVYWLSIETDDGGTTSKCPGRDKVRIEVIDQPKLNVSDIAFCEGTSASLDAVQGMTHTWLDPANNIVSTNKVFHLPTVPSAFYTLIADGGVNTRCKDVDTIFVGLINQPKLISDTCIWESQIPVNGLPLDALNGGIPFSGNVKFLWNNNATTQTINITQSGKYSVEASYSSPTFTSTVKCVDTAIINIINNAAIVKSTVVQAGDNAEIPDSEALLVGDSTSRTICTHQKLKLEALPAPSGHYYDVLWLQNGNLVSTNNAMIFQSNTADEYTISVNVGGCEETFTVYTHFCQVLPYNVITPNGDGFNDVFVFEGLENYPNSVLYIYNRHGRKVYESSNYQNDWSGDGLSDGVYHWVIEIQDGSYSTTMEGSVTLYRQ